MRKIDYGKVRWNASTNWEFCGSEGNLTEVWNRHFRELGVRVPIQEFGFQRPRRGLAFDRGDVVVHTDRTTGRKTYATVKAPVSSKGYVCVRFPDGRQADIHPNDIPEALEIADVPEELVALARSEADRTPDVSKCPLKTPCCAEGPGE